jgi:hypothetical protein
LVKVKASTRRSFRYRSNWPAGWGRGEPLPVEEFCAIYRRNARRVEGLLAPELARFGYERAVR